MKKNEITKEKIFQLIYMISSIVFLLFIPIIVIIKSKNMIDGYSELTKIRTNFSLGFSIFIFIVFIIDLILNKEKRKRVSSKKTIIIFLLFLIWCSISTLFSSNIEKSFFGIEYRYNGLIEYLSCFSFGILGFSLNQKNRKLYFRIFTIMALVVAALNVYNLKVSGNYLPTKDYSGIFYNINHYGYFISYSIIVIIFLYLYEKKIILKIVDFLVFCFFIYILIFNNTFGTYIAVLGTLVFICIYCGIKNKKIEFLILLAAFTTISVTTTFNDEYIVRKNFDELFGDLSIINHELKHSKYELGHDGNNISYVGNYRGKIWIYAFKYSLKKPIVGYGLDNLASAYLKDNITIDTPHNLILNLAATTGYPGMILYVGGLIVLIIQGLKKIKKNNNDLENLVVFLIIDHFISSMFGVTIYYVIPYFIIFLGMAVDLYDTKEKKLKIDKK